MRPNQITHENEWSKWKMGNDCSNRSFTFSALSQNDLVGRGEWQSWPGSLLKDAMAQCHSSLGRALLELKPSKCDNAKLGKLLI